MTIMAPTVPTTADIQEPATLDYESQLQTIAKNSAAKASSTVTVSDIETIAREMLSTLPKLNRDALRMEISLMHVPVYQDPTTFNINEGLALVQGYKDRLAAILTLATREFNLREQVFDMLVDTNNVMSKASSADKRKGEAIMKYYNAYIHLGAAETFMEEVERAMNNMKSIGEAISRQASVLSAQIQLGEYRKRQPGIEGDPNNPAEEMDYKSGVKKLDWDTM